MLSWALVGIERHLKNSSIGLWWIARAYIAKWPNVNASEMVDRTCINAPLLWHMGVVPATSRQ